MTEKNSGRDLPGVTQGDYELLAAFRNNLRGFLHFSEQAALAAGVPPQQHQALLAIRGFPVRQSVTVGELADCLKIKPHSAVGLVKRMCADGLVVKEAGREDARKVLVRLTASGERVLARLSATHKAELERIGPVLRQILRNLKQKP